MDYTIHGGNYKSAKQLFACCLLPIVCCLLLTSCKDKKDSFAVDYEYNYAPIDSGHYVIYDVDSINYSFTGVQTRDTAHYQLKEEVGDTFYLLNELCYELNLYRRENETSPWVYDSKWIIKRTGTTFQKKEGDIWFVKLVFPPEQDEEWNGNIYVPVTSTLYKDIFQDWIYHYETVGIPFSINGFNFDSTLTAVEVNDSNAINKRLRKEVYARNIGMIYQEWEILKAGAGVNPSWQTGNLNGFRIRMKVREHN